MNDVDLRDENDAPDEETFNDTDSADTHQKDAETVTVDLYVANAGKTERTGGPYLDDVERHNAETWRAQRENREPDYDNPPATAGTVLVPKSQLVERDTDKSHFSDNVEITNKPYTTVEVQTPSNEPDPAQPNFDNNYDRLKAFEAKERLDAVTGDTNTQADSQGTVAESETTESRINSAANEPEYVGDDAQDSSGFTGAEDAGDHTDTSTTGNDWDINGPGATGDVKQ